jgi:chromosome segregation ATPase
MAIPAEIKEVIRLAQIQSEEENKLQSLKDKKNELQAQLADNQEKIEQLKQVLSEAPKGLGSFGSHVVVYKATELAEQFLR